MRKSLAFGVCIVAVPTLVNLGGIESAHARNDYFKAFVAQYVGDKSTEAQKSLAEEVARVKQCHVCHDPRPDDSGNVSKKNRNPYGQALAKYMTEKDKKDQEKAAKMLGKVEAEKAGASAVTFGELLKVGKLPFEYPPEKSKPEKAN